MKKTLIGALVFNVWLYGGVSGVVFKDYNLNGVRDSNEVGVANIVVEAYDENNVKVAQATSLEDGSYNLDIANDGKYRIEFNNIPSNLKPGSAKAQSSSSVQFVENGASNVNLSLISIKEYNPGEDNVSIAVPTMHPGASTNQTDIDKQFGIVSLPYSASGDAKGEGDLNNPDFNKDATFSKMGTIWGTGYQKGSGVLYAAAFLKRHQGLGELARPEVDGGVQDVVVDGIYLMDYSGSVGGEYLGGFKLNGVTPANGNGGVINLGSVKREIISAEVDDSHPYALTTSTSNNRSFDVDAFDKVGRVGFGDLDIDESDNNLWVINLNQDSLIKVDITNSKALATNDTIDGSLVSHYKIDYSLITDCNGELHPWGLEFYNNKGYVGVVCDATSTKDASDLKAYILEFDSTNPTTFNLVKSFSLDYLKETSQFWLDEGVCALGSAGNWNYWAKSWDELGDALGPDADGADSADYGAERACPQPILSDITFDSNGDMIVGFIDRFSLQLDRVN
ncbi:MAG: hypothetical protein GXN91_04490, partial [Epsilonproteobacteria bacterium]|nr:hypothetical protein [Campylobacterota bacterium]